MSDAPSQPEKTTYIYYSGPIQRSGYEKLTDIVESVDRSTRCCLILTTTGGDPDAAFRMGRALGHYYEHTTCFVPDICKSAGTLLAIAAHELVIADTGELGPLDIQLSKPDEMFERSSGLVLPSALEKLESLAIQSFRDFVTDIKVGGGVSTKLASEVATNLTSALVEPIVSQIDPLRLGEHNRAMQIAFHYGDRLNRKFKNLKKHAIVRLVSGYPHHGFVIDRKEASELFVSVRAPNDIESGLHATLNDAIANQRWSSDVQVFILPDELIHPEEKDESEVTINEQGADDENVVQIDEKLARANDEEGNSEVEGGKDDPNQDSPSSPG